MANLSGTGFSEILARHRVRDRPSGSGVSASVDLGASEGELEPAMEILLAQDEDLGIGRYLGSVSTLVKQTAAREDLGKLVDGPPCLICWACSLADLGRQQMYCE